MVVVLFSAVGSGFPGRIVVQQSQSDVSVPQQPNNAKRVNQKDEQGRSLSGIEEIKSHFPKVDYDAQNLRTRLKKPNGVIRASTLTTWAASVRSQHIILQVL